MLLKSKISEQYIFFAVDWSSFMYYNKMRQTYSDNYIFVYAFQFNQTVFHFPLSDYFKQFFLLKHTIDFIIKTYTII